MRVFSTNDKVLLQKKYRPPLPQNKQTIVTPKLLPKKTTAIYNMTNEIKEKEKIMMKWKMIKRKTRNRKKLHPLLLSKKKCFSSTEHTFSQDVWKLCFKQYIMNWNKHRQKALILNCFLFSLLILLLWINLTFFSKNI